MKNTISKKKKEKTPEKKKEKTPEKRRERSRSPQKQKVDRRRERSTNIIYKDDDEDMTESSAEEQPDQSYRARRIDPTAIKRETRGTNRIKK